MQHSLKWTFANCICHLVIGRVLGRPWLVSRRRTRRARNESVRGAAENRSGSAQQHRLPALWRERQATSLWPLQLQLWRRKGKFTRFSLKSFEIYSETQPVWTNTLCSQKMEPKTAERHCAESWSVFKVGFNARPHALVAPLQNIRAGEKHLKLGFHPHWFPTMAKQTGWCHF